MKFTTADAEQYVRMTLKQWNLAHVRIEWQEFAHFGDANPYTNVLRLSLKVCHSFELLREVTLHEVAHFLQALEMGNTFRVNGKNHFHNKIWREQCKKVGVRARRFIPF